MLGHASPKRFVRLGDLFRDLVVQDEENGELLNRAEVNKENWRKSKLLSLFVQHLIEGASRITLGCNLLNPWPMPSDGICWLRLWKVRILLQIEGLCFGELSHEVGQGERDHRK